MSISSVSSLGSWISELSQVNGNQRTRSGTASNIQATDPPPGPPPGGGLLEAVMQALAQISTDSSSSSSSSDTTSASTSTESTKSSTTSIEDMAQALATFMQSMMAALHDQNNGDDTSAEGANSASGTFGGPGSGHGPRPDIASDLQSLIAELSSSSAEDSSSTSNLSDLQQSFQDLLAALGITGNDASLENFLQSLAGNMQDPGYSGNVVDTQA